MAGMAAVIPDPKRIRPFATAKALETWLRTTFKRLNRANLFALRFRTNNMKTAAGREKMVATLVAMLARGGTIIPQK